MEGPLHMSTVSDYIFVLILISIEVWIIVYLSTRLFSALHSQKFYNISVLILLSFEIFWQLIWAEYLSNELFVKYLVNFAMILVWLLVVYQDNIIKLSFFIILVLSYFTIVDNLFIGLVSFSAEKILHILENPYAYFAMCCCAKIAELLGIQIICNVTNKKTSFIVSSSWRDWVRVLFFPFSTLIVSLMMSYILLFDLKYAKEISMCMFVMLMIDLISICLLDHLEESHRVILENAILRQSLKLESEHIASLQNNYEQQRKQTHDFYNQLAILQGFAERKVPPEEFSKYLGTLLATKPPAGFYINTHRTVVDVILSQKVPIARGNNIDFQLQLEDLSHFPLPDNALVVILTNLIDNAIDACEKIPVEQERFIQLVMKTEETTAWICIENTTAVPITIQNNYVPTTKDDSLLHGFGLKNVSALISQHNGSYILDYREKDHRFCFYAKIPVSGYF